MLKRGGLRFPGEARGLHCHRTEGSENMAELEQRYMARLDCIAHGCEAQQRTGAGQPQGPQGRAMVGQTGPKGPQKSCGQLVQAHQLFKVHSCHKLRVVQLYTYTSYKSYTCLEIV